MTSLSEKALEILQASGETNFTSFYLINNGFSKATAKGVINELEDAGYIFTKKLFVNGNVSFELL